MNDLSTTLPSSPEMLRALEGLLQNARDLRDASTGEEKLFIGRVAGYVRDIHTMRTEYQRATPDQREELGDKEYKYFSQLHAWIKRYAHLQQNSGVAGFMADLQSNQRRYYLSGLFNEECPEKDALMIYGAFAEQPVPALPPLQTYDNPSPLPQSNAGAPRAAIDLNFEERRDTAAPDPMDEIEQLLGEDKIHIVTDASVRPMPRVIHPRTTEQPLPAPVLAGELIKELESLMGPATGTREKAVDVRATLMSVQKLAEASAVAKQQPAADAADLPRDISYHLNGLRLPGQAPVAKPVAEKIADPLAGLRAGNLPAAKPIDPADLAPMPDLNESLANIKAASASDIAVTEAPAQIAETVAETIAEAKPTVRIPPVARSLESIIGDEDLAPYTKLKAWTNLDAGTPEFAKDPSTLKLEAGFTTETASIPAHVAGFAITENLPLASDGVRPVPSTIGQTMAAFPEQQDGQAHAAFTRMGINTQNFLDLVPLDEKSADEPAAQEEPVTIADETPAPYVPREGITWYHPENNAAQADATSLEDRVLSYLDGEQDSGLAEPESKINEDPEQLSADTVNSGILQGMEEALSTLPNVEEIKRTRSNIKDESMPAYLAIRAILVEKEEEKLAKENDAAQSIDDEKIHQQTLHIYRSIPGTERPAFDAAIADATRSVPGKEQTLQQIFIQGYLKDFVDKAVLYERGNAESPADDLNLLSQRDGSIRVIVATGQPLLVKQNKQKIENAQNDTSIFTADQDYDQSVQAYKKFIADNLGGLSQFLDNLEQQINQTAYKNKNDVQNFVSEFAYEIRGFLNYYVGTLKRQGGDFTQSLKDRLGLMEAVDVVHERLSSLATSMGQILAPEKSEQTFVARNTAALESLQNLEWAMEIARRGIIHIAPMQQIFINKFTDTHLSGDRLDEQVTNFFADYYEPRYGSEAEAKAQRVAGHYAGMLANRMDANKGYTNDAVEAHEKVLAVIADASLNSKEKAPAVKILGQFMDEMDRLDNAEQRKPGKGILRAFKDAAKNASINAAIQNATKLLDQFIAAPYEAPRTEVTEAPAAATPNVPENDISSETPDAPVTDIEPVARETGTVALPPVVAVSEPVQTEKPRSAIARRIDEQDARAREIVEGVTTANIVQTMDGDTSAIDTGTSVNAMLASAVALGAKKENAVAAEQVDAPLIETPAQKITPSIRGSIAEHGMPATQPSMAYAMASGGFSSCQTCSAAFGDVSRAAPEIDFEALKAAVGVPAPVQIVSADTGETPAPAAIPVQKHDDASHPLMAHAALGAKPVVQPTVKKGQEFAAIAFAEIGSGTKTAAKWSLKTAAAIGRRWPMALGAGIGYGVKMGAGAGGTLIGAPLVVAIITAGTLGMFMGRVSYKMGQNLPAEYHEMQTGRNPAKWFMKRGIEFGAWADGFSQSFNFSTAIAMRDTIYKTPGLLKQAYDAMILDVKANGTAGLKTNHLKRAGMVLGHMARIDGEATSMLLGGVTGGVAAGVAFTLTHWLGIAPAHAATPQAPNFCPPESDIGTFEDFKKLFPVANAPAGNEIAPVVTPAPEAATAATPAEAVTDNSTLAADAPAQMETPVQEQPIQQAPAEQAVTQPQTAAEPFQESAAQTDENLDIDNMPGNYTDTDPFGNGVDLQPEVPADPAAVRLSTAFQPVGDYWQSALDHNQIPEALRGRVEELLADAKGGNPVAAIGLADMEVRGGVYTNGGHTFVPVDGLVKPDAAALTAVADLNREIVAIDKLIDDKAWNWSGAHGQPQQSYLDTIAQNAPKPASPKLS